MTKIKPFKAVIYNQEKIKDLSKVVCPPYDIIPPQKQEHYHDADPHNFIRIILGRDVAGEDKYARAAEYFKDWLTDEVLVQETHPAIYFYIQEYNLKGEKKVRLGFLSLLRLEDKNSSVFAHEHTRLAPKEDRLKLLKKVKANLSPIFVVFQDAHRVIQRVYQQSVQGKKPFIDITDEDKIRHKVWRIDNPETLNKIEEKMREENIFIADGHHRYEVASIYREMMKQELGTIKGEEGFNYILAYFTNADPRGLTILPVHRLLKLNKEMGMEMLKERLKEYFYIEEVKDKARLFFLMEKGGRTEPLLGIYKDKKYWLLRLQNIKILDKMIPDKPKEYKSLEASILNYIILHKILGLKPEEKDNLEFSPEADEFIKRVDEDPGLIAFFLNPVKMAQITAVALKGERMPPKSTYFYPKVLSGLVINKFE